MGGVWCKADRGQTRSFSTKSPFNTTFSRWTENVRQAYRKPKTYHRPPRPPQKPSRSNGRLTIGHPQLVKEESSDGWRTATLTVPESVPVPPPRKKRKRAQELARTAFSMDDLDRVEPMTDSRLGKHHSEPGLDSCTLVVTPVLETRAEHLTEKEDVKQAEDKKNTKNDLERRVEEEYEEEEDMDEIIPIEKETLFSSKTILHSNLGYIDKLSAISEVSAESGFDDRIDIAKCSERSESVTSSESVPQETGLNILAHIHNIHNVSQMNDINNEIREKTAISKKEWLQSILREEPEPYFISRDTFKDTRARSESLPLDGRTEVTKQRNSLYGEYFHVENCEEETLIEHNKINKTPPPSPVPACDPLMKDAATNHSVLLELLQKNTVANEESIVNPLPLKGESIFLTNTKTNIIYKSSSTDNLTEIYDIDYPAEGGINSADSTLSKKEDVLKPGSTSEGKCGPDSTNSLNDPSAKPHLSDYSFQTAKLVEHDVGLNSLQEEKRSNVISSFDFKDITKSQNYVTALKDLALSEEKPAGANPIILVNGVDSDSSTSAVTSTSNDNKDGATVVKEPLTKNDSFSSSRRSSITDSLHEFEMSIYDMLKESKKGRESSDEEDSLKTFKLEKRQ